MNLIKVSELFDVKYGVNLELSNVDKLKNEIPFIARTEKNNGMTAYVSIIRKVKPNPANTISVAGGGSVLSSFLQKKPYYSGRDLYYLKPKQKLSDNEMLFYCMCLRANKYRYSYGRQANKTLKNIKIPTIKSIPSWVYETKTPKIKKTPLIDNKYELSINNWKYFQLNELFDFEKGKSIKNKLEKGKFPLITSSQFNNGVSGFYNSKNKFFEKNKITVASNGSVGSTFYQNKHFIASGDVNVLSLKNFKLNSFISCFLCKIIEFESFRFNYGRKWGINRMKEHKIKLPIDKSNNPDWKFMEKYIKSLPYSNNL